MKRYYVAFILLFSFQHSFAQSEDLLNGLPPYYKYQIFTDSIPFIEQGYCLHCGIHFSQDSLDIGCLGQHLVKPEFTLMITMQNPYRDSFLNLQDVTVEAQFPLLMYFVPLQHQPSDSLVEASVDYYCYYGISNFYFKTNDYIVFTHDHQGMYGADLLIRSNIWDRLVAQLISNLVNAPIAAQAHGPDFQFASTEVRQKIPGEYLFTPVPAQDQFQNQIILEKAPEISSQKLTLKKSGRLHLVVNYNQEINRRYHYKGRWTTDGDFIYVFVDQRGLSTYALSDNGLLVALDQRSVYIRSREQ